MTGVLKLRDYQVEAINAVFRHLKYNVGEERNCVVKAATGAGKAFMAAQIAEIVTNYNNWRCLIIAHRKELIEQNSADKYYQNPDRVSIYSASVGEKDPTGRIVVGQIQSIYSRAHALGDFNLIVIDEIHRYDFEDDDARTMYGQLLSMYEHTPVVGLSATPYRMKEGDIPWEIVYAIEPYQLIDQGYLVPLVNKIHDLQLNLSDISIRQGDYVTSELQDLMQSGDRLATSIATLLKYGANRKCWIVFCVDIEHCFNVNQFLRQAGIKSEMVTSGTSKGERERIFEQHRSGEVTCLVNVMVATEGYDNPKIDMIGLLRPTKSKALAEQMIGRGLRTVYADGYNLDELSGRLGAIQFGEKPNCLVVDMADILVEHGGVGSPNYKLYDGRGDGEEYTHKVCPSCESDVPIAASICECGYVFSIINKRGLKHNLTTDEKSDTVWKPGQMEDNEKSFDITEITFEKNPPKEGKHESVRLRYYSGYTEVHSEWLFFRHPQFSFPYDKTVTQMVEMCRDPKDVDVIFESDAPEIALTNLLHADQIKRPIRLDIKRQKKNPKYFETVRRYYAKEESEEAEGIGSSNSLGELLEDEIRY